MCRKDNKNYDSNLALSEQKENLKINEDYLEELYKRAWLKNDTGAFCEYCLNTTTWD